MTPAGPWRVTLPRAAGEESADNTAPKPRTRHVQAERRFKRREQRWREQRFSVPYPVDGPKVSLGVLWFGGLLTAAYLQPWVVFVVASPVAVVAALQTGHAWSKQELSDRIAAAIGAGLVCLGTLAGALGLGATVAVVTLGLTAYAWSHVGPSTDVRVRLAEILVRAAVPVGIAGGSLIVVAVERTPAFVALVLLISAYETGDFVVGSGSANAVEGPVAGLVAMALVGIGLFLVLPEPFTETTLPVYVALVAICAPLGQIAGSAVLPRGDAWAPALRRLDSYLVAAPLWLVTVG